MSSPPPAPATTQQTQVSQMSPEQWSALYGNPNAVGAQNLRNSSQIAAMLEGVQKGDKAALSSFYGGKSAAAMNPNTIPAVNAMPYQNATPEAIARANSVQKAADGGELNSAQALFNQYGMIYDPMTGRVYSTRD